MYILCDYQTLLLTEGYKGNFEIYINYAMNYGLSIRYFICRVSYEISDIFGPLDEVIIIMHAIYDYEMITYK
jgi:hypothetical protein